MFALPATTITAAMPKLAREGQRDVFLSDLCPSVKSVTSVFDSWFDLFSWVAGVPRWEIRGSPLCLPFVCFVVRALPGDHQLAASKWSDAFVESEPLPA